MSLDLGNASPEDHQTAKNKRQLLRVTLLGKFGLWHGETAVILHTPSYQALLAYLLLHPDQLHTRQHLAFTFWPDSTDKQARTNLRKALYYLRHTLPDLELFLQVDTHQIGWCHTASYELDVAAFETAVATAKQATLPGEQYQLMNQALDLYTGDLLPDHYNEWIIFRRELLRQDYLACLAQLVQLAENCRDYLAASNYAHRLLREDPLQEAAYRSLMRLQALAGNRAGALRTFHTCATRLQRELCVLPSPATQDAYRQLLNLETVHASPLPERFPLVAREKSWATLQKWWQRATCQQPLLALLCGEAGIGKTRLAEELLDWAARQGITALSATCFAAAGNLSYAPVASWLRAEVMHKPLTRLADKWQREVGRVMPELLAARPDLTPPNPITERWQQQHLFTALASAILSAKQPLLLFIDNLQWCDPDTLAWLCFLLRYDAQARCLLLGAVRTGESSSGSLLAALCQDLRQDDRIVELELGRLDAPATAMLAGYVTSQAPDTDLAARLFAETEGVPLFIVEFARAGEPKPMSSERFSAKAEPVGVALPVRVRGVIETRLANLSSAARELVGLAAAIGRFFTYELLALASEEPETQLVPALDELWQQRIIREQGTEGYDFSHDKIRQVAYASLSAAKRRWLHGRIASALEALPAKDLDSVSGKLASHCEAAGRTNKAIFYYQRAADVAQAIYANQETIQYLQRAVALFPQGEVEEQQQFEIYKQLSNVLMRVAQFEEAEGILVEVIASTMNCWNLSWLYRSLAGAQGMQRCLDNAFLSLQSAEEALGQSTQALSEAWWEAWLEIKLTQLDLYFFTNQTEEMIHLGSEICQIVEQYGSPEQCIKYARFLTKCGFRQERYVLSAQTLTHAEMAYAAAETTGIVDLIANCLFDLAMANLWLGWQGNLTKAEHLFEELQSLAEQRGNIHLRARCLNYRLLINRRRGKIERVSELVEEALLAAKECNFQTYISIVEGNLAWLRWKEEELAAAKSHGEKAYTRFRSLAATSSFRWTALWPLIVIAVRQDEIKKAVGYARNLLDPTQMRLRDEVTAVLHQAISAWENKQVASARTHLEQALNLAQTYHYL